jgi:hypothetical protein
MSARWLLLVCLLSAMSACSRSGEGKSADKSDDKDKKIKPIAEVVKDADKIDGLLPVYRDRKTGKAWLELSDKQLGAEFILFTYTENGLAGVGHFRGNYRDHRVVVFRRDYDKVAVVARNTAFYFDPASALSRASAANVSEAVLAVQKIVGQDEKRGAVLIEADGLFLADHLHQIKPADPENKDRSRFTLGKLSTDKTRFASIRNYPANSDFVVEYVYEEKAPTGKVADDVTDPRYVSLLLQYSLIAMPANDYQPRFDDERVGYFTTRVTDMTSTSAVPYRDLLHRWNLRKKDPSSALSEPVEPIVWWIENTTPRELRGTIRDAALRWNQAFEKAGFANALVVKEQPDDATWDAGDIRYNVLRWTSSPNPPFGGYGPSFVNPRTGQILGADIMLEWVFVTNRVRYARLWEEAGGAWEDSAWPLCSLGHHLHASTLAAAHALKLGGAPDVEASRLLKEGVYYLVLHELGHTLGLNHNMKSSQLHDPGAIHDRALTERTGLTGSVMDYPAVNLAPIGAAQGQYYTTAPGPYDLWAIEFGYGPHVDDPATRAKLLARSAEPALTFGNDADDMRSSSRGIDPRVMIGDLSTDAVGYAADRIRRVNAAMDGALERYTGQDGSYHELRDAYMTLTREHANAAGIIARYVGGVYVERVAPGQTGAPRPLTPVPAEQQRRAMKTLAERVFAPDALRAPQALLAHARLQRRGFEFSEENEDLPLHTHLTKIPAAALDHLLHAKTLQRLSDTALYGQPYPLGEMFGDLTAAVFDADRAAPAHSLRRWVQSDYVSRLIAIVGDPDRPSKFDPLSQAAAWGELERIRRDCARTEPAWDPATRTHRRHLLWRIDQAMGGHANSTPARQP